MVIDRYFAMYNLLFRSAPCLAFLFLSGCVQTSAVRLDESKNYAPSSHVMILESPPIDAYEVIAQLETRGTQGQSIPALLEDMRKQARDLGADAIIPVEHTSEQTPVGVIYNPWLEGYQTYGGVRIPIVRGYAIILESSKSSRAASYKRKRDTGFGTTVNAAPFALSGYGFGIWGGKQRFRFFGSYHAHDVPAVFYRDGFIDGRVESALTAGLDYFFIRDLQGLYMGTSLGHSSSSFGHEDELNRGEFRSLIWFMDMGYLFRITPNIHFDVRLSLGGRVAGETRVDLGRRVLVPDTAVPGGFVGLGINL